MQQATCSLHCDADAPRAAREFVRDVLRRWQVDPRTIEDAQLLASEIVSNAVMYGRCARTEVRLTFDGVLTVAVSDAAPDIGFVSSPPAGGASGGWGLNLVSTISDSWGSTRTTTGKVVWFVLAVDSHDANRSDARGTSSHRSIWDDR